MNSFKMGNRLNRFFWFFTFISLFKYIAVGKLGARRRPIAFNIRIHNVGMFASFNWLLYVALFCEKYSIEEYDVVFPDTIYGISRENSTNNWITGLVEIRKSKIRQLQSYKRVYISNLKSFPGVRREVANLNLSEGNSLFFRNYCFSFEIISALEEFIVANQLSKYIAIHFRGTDKILEASSVQVDEYLAHLESVLIGSNYEYETVYLASDDGLALGRLIERISSTWPNLHIVYQEDIQRSFDGKPVHLKLNSNNETARLKAFEALLEAILLSKSEILIRNSSFLSSWASVFNPALQVVLLNEPFENKRWFPESAILDERKS